MDSIRDLIKREAMRKCSSSHWLMFNFQINQRLPENSKFISLFIVKFGYVGTAIDQRITRTTSTRLADLESTLAGQTSAAQQQVADALTELNTQTQSARDQRIEAEQLVLALHNLHMLVTEETLAFRAERELLQKAKSKKSFFSSIFG